MAVDRASPESRSFNDGIETELCSLQYVRLDNVSSRIVKVGRGAQLAQLAKLDIESAYRMIPVHLGDRNPTAPTAVVIHIKQSKTDPFRQGVSIYLGKMESMLCPVASLLSYLVVWGKDGGPLFRFKDGRPLTRPLLVAALKKVLSSVGFKPENYAGHSFQIGAATTAAACGVPVEIIKSLGRWKSDVYQLYVRLPTDQLSSISKQLAQSRI